MPENNRRSSTGDHTRARSLHEIRNPVLLCFVSKFFLLWRKVLSQLSRILTCFLFDILQQMQLVILALGP